jgi:hypothetical protein
MHVLNHARLLECLDELLLPLGARGWRGHNGRLWSGVAKF